MSYSEVLKLAEQLIAKPSITPHDHGCQDLIADYLNNLGFEIQHMPANEVKNLWAIKNHHESHTDSPCIVFAGHTDVVPTGPIEHWQTKPFTPVIKDNILYGRGAADMKGSLAAMLVSVKNFLNKNTSFKGSIGFLITSDEEGPALHGTKHVVEQLLKNSQKIDYCVVGEPSSTSHIGDVIKNGRRGSLTGHLTVYGKQGHAAYPHKAQNAVHLCLDFLKEFTTTKWDDGNEDFPPTTMQIIDVKAGSGASNIIPGAIEIEFNFRYSTNHNFESLTETVEKVLNQHNLKYDIDWCHYASPFLTKRGAFTKMVQQAVTSITNKSCQLATTGGTSDGRFIFPAFNCDLIELGPLNHCIHHVNEHVNVNDLNILSQIYENILTKLFIENYIGNYQCSTQAAL